MSDPGPQLSASTRQVVRRYLRTFEDLEILLLLARDANRYWSASAAGVELGLSQASARKALDALASRNLLDVRLGEDVLYRLDRNTPTTAKALDTILDAARRQRTAVLSTVAGAGRAVGDFADAFRITRRKRDDG